MIFLTSCSLLSTVDKVGGANGRKEHLASLLGWLLNSGVLQFTLLMVLHFIMSVVNLILVSQNSVKDEVAQALSDNYNLAEFIRDRLIPRAVLFFTGEAAEEEEDDEVHPVRMII